MHPTLGEVTLRELLATWAVHDLDHIGQINARLAGSHNADACEPERFPLTERRFIEARATANGGDARQRVVEGEP